MFLRGLGNERLDGCDDVEEPTEKHLPAGLDKFPHEGEVIVAYRRLHDGTYRNAEERQCKNEYGNDDKKADHMITEIGLPLRFLRVVGQ